MTDLHPLLSLDRWPADVESDVAIHGIARCPHGAYGATDCTLAHCQGEAAQHALDHAHWWWPAQGAPYLLAHVYSTTKHASRVAEALAHPFGLRVDLGCPEDDWYGYGTVPIRYSLPAGHNQFFPLEVALLAGWECHAASNEAHRVEAATKEPGWLALSPDRLTRVRALQQARLRALLAGDGTRDTPHTSDAGAGR